MRILKKKAKEDVGPSAYETSTLLLPYERERIRSVWTSDL